MNRSITLEGSFTIDEPVAKLFPLFSPIGEKEWAPDWDPELIYPPDTEWDEGLIFRTPSDYADASIWIVMHLDRERHRVGYFRVEGSTLAVRVNVDCTAISADSTRVVVTYLFVGLSATGDEAIAGMSQAAYDEKMLDWKRLIEK